MCQLGIVARWTAVCCGFGLRRAVCSSLDLGSRPWRRRLRRAATVAWPSKPRKKRWALLDARN